MGEHKHLHGAGKSSYSFVDKERLLNAIGLGRGETFLDLGCGRGEYSLLAAGQAGPDGGVFSFDLWTEGIEALRQAAEKGNISWLHAEVQDIAGNYPLAGNSIDACLLSTVVHDVGREHPGMFEEIRRVLRPEGRVAVIEYSKVEDTPGPPLSVRMEENELVGLMESNGFAHVSTHPLAGFLYLALFSR